ncbi:MAG: pilus assembly protein PilM [Gemmatimonadetes bacterium]|nr:pilus assembly protein PilM [Gemmatimonadota bacterium]
MALFPRARSTVGLDIGSGYIKAVVINHGSGQPVLEKVAMARVPDDAIVEGEVMDPSLVAETVRSLLDRAQIKTREVAVAVGGRDVIIKKILMDRMRDAEAREVMPWEADQHVPFDKENVELDFQILDPDADGLQMQVLLVAAKRELVESKLVLPRRDRPGSQRDRCRSLRAAQRLRAQLSRSDARCGGAGECRPRDHDHQSARGRRAGPHPRLAGGRPSPPRRSAA